MKHIISILLILITISVNSQSLNLNNNTVTLNDYGTVLNGTTTVWDDVMMPFNTGNTAGTGYPQFKADSGYYRFVIDTTGSSKCIIYMNVQMPHKWKEGSSIEPHIHYKVEGTTDPNVRVKYRWFNIDNSSYTSWSYYNLNKRSSTTAGNHAALYNSTPISGTDKTISSIFQCQIYVTAYETGKTELNAYQFDVHYEIDTQGSRNSLPPK